MVNQNGLLFIVSAPSGAGKTSLLQAILQTNKQLNLVVSHTSRTPRVGEQDGIHYHFVSKTQFENLIWQHAFIEYAEVHGNYYGTSLKEIQQKCAQGEDVLLEIDVQGAMQVKQQIPAAVLIFILPPSLTELKQRLQQRSTDEAAVIDLRIKNACLEIKQAVYFDYLVINDNFAVAKADLESIFRAERLAVRRNNDILDNVLETY